VVVGVIAVVLGVILTVAGFALFGSAWSNPLQGASSGFSGITLCAIGGFLLIPGLFLIYVSQVRRVTSYVAGETAPAVRTTSGAAGQGLVEGMRQGGGIPLTITAQPGGTGPAASIRVRCRNCGYLETEDAAFCSQCRTPMR